MKKTISLLVLIITLSLNAQQSVKLKINHKLGSQNFALNQSSTNNLANTFNVGRMQYYVSQIEIIHDGSQTSSINGVYTLVDATTNTMIDLGSLNITTVEGVKFYIGVNQPENNNDPALWPSNHALAPKNPSMHWGWASGYFFVAMSGYGGNLLNNAYELHGLGNINYFSQTITTGATLLGSDLIISLDADYEQALKNIDVSSGVISHGETGDAATIISNFKNYVFSATPTTVTTVGLEEQTLSSISPLFYPNPSVTGKFNLNRSNVPANSSSIIVTDYTGRMIKNIAMNELENNELTLNSKGVYFVQIMSGDKLLYTQKIVSL